MKELAQSASFPAIVLPAMIEFAIVKPVFPMNPPPRFEAVFRAMVRLFITVVPFPV